MIYGLDYLRRRKWQKRSDDGAGWASNLLNECRSLNVAFFMKQIKQKNPIPDLLVRQFPFAAEFGKRRR